MTGILELFASFSEPDEFDVQAQLELFGWQERAANRDRAREAMAKRYRTDAEYREQKKKATSSRYKTDAEYREQFKAYQRARYRARKRAEARAA